MRPVSEILSSTDFDRITDLAWRTCGIDLKNGKRELVQARLGKKIRQGNFRSFKDYVDHVVADTTGEELTGLLDALTTNFTSFLREAAHFDLLRKTIVPGIRGEIRIWSAACSTGEEPWTIAFSLLEELGSSAADRVQIMASDISSRALAIAERGAYEAERLRDLPVDWPSKYLLRGSDRWEGWFRVKPFIRRMVEFRRFNLMETFHPPQPFHAIFCRNVMIYFDKDTQEQLVNRFACCMQPGGYLLTGHSESLTGLKHPLQYVSPSVYRTPQLARSTSKSEKALWGGPSGLPPSFGSARSVTSVPAALAISWRRSYEPRLNGVAMALRATKMNEDAARDTTKPVAPASLSPVFVSRPNRVSKETPGEGATGGS